MEDTRLIPSFYDERGEPQFTLEDLAKQLNISVGELTQLIENVAKNVKNPQDFHKKPEAIQ